MKNKLLRTFLLGICWLSFFTTEGWAQEEFDNSLSQAELLLEKAAATPNTVSSLQMARQALNMAEGTRNPSLLYRTHRLIADGSLKINETDTAIVHYLEAIKTTEKMPSGRNLKADIFTIIGDIFMRTQLYANAIPYFDSVQYLQPGNYEVREKRGDAYLQDGKIQLAELSYSPVIGKYQVEGNLIHVVDIYQKLADASNRAHDPDAGVRYYQLIQDIVERIGSPKEKARLYNNLGYQYYLAKDYQAAIQTFEKARLQCQYTNCEHPELHLLNLGIVLHTIRQSEKGVAYMLEAREELVKRKDKKALANAEHLIAKTFLGFNDYYNALKYNEMAIQHAQETKQDDIWRNASKTAAEIHLELYDHEKAIAYYRTYLRLDDSLRLVEQNQQRSLLRRQSLLERTERNTQLNLRSKTIRELYNDRIEKEQENLRLANKQLELEKRQKEFSLKLLQSQQQISESEARQQALELLKLNQQVKIDAQQRAFAELRRQEEIEKTKQQAKDSISTREREILKQQAKLSELQLQQEATFRKFASAGGVLACIILGLLGAGWWISRRTGKRLRAQNKRIEAQKSLIEKERAKSDSLLRNILPDEIAAELKIAGVATPRKYDKVTVLFSDFVSFTKLSEHLTPEQLIDELDECFLAFDEICEKHNLEKIKTIGDAYMCAGGVPVPNETSPEDAVAAAIEMQQWLQKRNAENPNAIFKEMRIGIHTGPVIAGVVGKNKFAYDIWGDAVNLAARLEELGEPGKVNISEDTQHLIKHRYSCVSRGSQKVHNKGNVTMYFVEH